MTSFWVSIYSLNNVYWEEPGTATCAHDTRYMSTWYMRTTLLLPSPWACRQMARRYIENWHGCARKSKQGPEIETMSLTRRNHTLDKLLGKAWPGRWYIAGSQETSTTRGQEPGGGAHGCGAETPVRLDSLVWGGGEHEMKLPRPEPKHAASCQACQKV